MRIQIATAIILLSTFTLLFSGCAVIKKLSGNSTGAYSALLSKKQELADFQPTNDTPASSSGNQTPQVKGKVVIVKKEGGAEPQLDRFDSEGKFSEDPVGNGKSSLFYPPEVYAKTPEEIGTLIKIECDEKEGSDYYKAVNGNSPSQRQSFLKTICDVSVIDYKTKSLLAKVQKGDTSAPGTITLGEGGNSYYETFKEIKDYLTGLPLELIQKAKPTPNGEVIPVAELVKLFKKSKESISRYQDKEITVNGWGLLTASHDGFFLYDSEKRSGDSVMCKIEPADAAGFAGVKEFETQKFTVIGKFDGKITMTLENCRLIAAEKSASK